MCTLLQKDLFSHFLVINYLPMFIFKTHYHIDTLIIWLRKRWWRWSSNNIINLSCLYVNVFYVSTVLFKNIYVNNSQIDAYLGIFIIWNCHNLEHLLQALHSTYNISVYSTCSLYIGIKFKLNYHYYIIYTKIYNCIAKTPQICSDSKYNDINYYKQNYVNM